MNPMYPLFIALIIVCALFVCVLFAFQVIVTRSLNPLTFFTLIHELGHAICIRKIISKYKINYEPSIILIGSKYAPMTKPKHSTIFKNYILKFYKGNQGKGLSLSPHATYFSPEEIAKIAKAGYQAVKIFILIVFFVFLMMCILINTVLHFSVPISILALIFITVFSALMLFHYDFLRSSDYLYFSDPDQFDRHNVCSLYHAYAENQYDECHNEDPTK